ncbi:hypothetical protein RHSIM_Rhsim08G0202000 [Rhododendron simsii]|uniref:XPC-binding domain-containing protein n=1 Tax=Rhododendron simsii TaxID=118357 RepID=A0A834LGF3_RHOSS|nr:hypothetical protein RHSIM_Rhsim08G0202000 [Rhododendron simsii]
MVNGNPKTITPCICFLILWILKLLKFSLLQTLLKTAEELWTSVKDLYGHQHNTARVYQLQQAISNCKQGDHSFVEYFGELKSMWYELGLHRPPTIALVTLQKRAEQDKVFQLLADVKPEFENLRGQILMGFETLSLSSVCASIQQEETRKKAMNIDQKSLIINSEASALLMDKEKFSTTRSKTVILIRSIILSLIRGVAVMLLISALYSPQSQPETLEFPKRATNGSIRRSYLRCLIRRTSECHQGSMGQIQRIQTPLGSTRINRTPDDPNIRRNRESEPGRPPARQGVRGFRPPTQRSEEPRAEVRQGALVEQELVREEADRVRQIAHEVLPDGRVGADSAYRASAGVDSGWGAAEERVSGGGVARATPFQIYQKKKNFYNTNLELSSQRNNKKLELRKSSGSNEDMDYFEDISTATKDGGIPEAAEVAVPVAHLPANQTASGGVETGVAAGAPVSGVPNSSPLNLFPQEAVPAGGAGAGLGPLDFLRNSQQPMLQELGKRNTQLLRLIQERQAEFLQLINEPVV